MKKNNKEEVKEKVKEEVLAEDKKEDEELSKLYEAYNKISELEDKIIRQNADMINYRKRKEEEINKMLKYANEDIVLDLIPTIDSFERAMSIKINDDAMSKYLDGFKMIYANMISILNKYGVKAIDGSDKPFDPTYHQAVLTEHVDDKEAGIVLEVMQKGYLLKDKVIRPAMVKVSE